MARFFIDRPVFATVISVVITLIGGLAIFSLPIAQYPEVVPPQVRVTAAYRGANAQDVEKTVAAPIEQQLVGLSDGFLVRVKDVGRVELGAADYRRFAGRDGTAAASIGISQMPGANAAATAGRERPELTSVSSPFRVSVPQLSVSLARDKAETLGIPVTDVYDALQTFLGGVYVNDFNLFGRTWKMLMQADADFRLSPDDVDRFYVRTQGGLMVPLTALISIKTASGPEVVYRYNRYRAARIFGAVAPGYRAGQGSAVMEELAAKVLPAGFGYEWTGTVYQQRKAEGQEPIIFGLSAILVLLLLAALYESWATPFAVVLSVPLGIFGAVVGVWLRAYAYDVYTQIGIVTLIGLAAKNAILIVEFAKLRREEGLSIVDAAVEAARIRLRPILMTSFAFILGVVPLVMPAAPAPAPGVRWAPRSSPA